MLFLIFCAQVLWQTIKSISCICASSTRSSLDVEDLERYLLTSLLYEELHDKFNLLKLVMVVNYVFVLVFLLHYINH